MDQHVEDLDTARADIQADLVSKEGALSALEDAPETDVRQWQAAADAAKAEADQCRTTLTECQISAATLQEQVRHGEEQLTQHASRQDELTSPARSFEEAAGRTAELPSDYGAALTGPGQEYRRQAGRNGPLR